MLSLNDCKIYAVLKCIQSSIWPNIMFNLDVFRVICLTWLYFVFLIFGLCNRYFLAFSIELVVCEALDISANSWLFEQTTCWVNGNMNISWSHHTVFCALHTLFSLYILFIEIETINIMYTTQHPQNWPLSIFIVSDIFGLSWIPTFLASL